MGRLIMTTARHFVRRGEALRAVPYEYQECGLAGIYLHSGYETAGHEGEQYVSVFDTVGLHRCIGHQIVYMRKELAPEEIKFLRKTMDLTQSELGQWMGQSGQQVARWEKGHSTIPGPADRLLRAIFLSETHGQDDDWNFMDFLRSIEELDDSPPRTLAFCFDGDSWQQERRAA
jgi:DNA-binding transcriptional regulator YiaG